MTLPDLTQSTRRRAALAYAAAGWHVFPLHGMRLDDAGRLVCTCGVSTCRSPGKHTSSPLATNGYRDATRSEARIKKWWPTDDSPWSIGVRTGNRSRIYVVDVPAGQDLPDGLPATLMAETGRGGHHLYYRHPGVTPWTNTSNVLGVGVLTRGDGGFVVAPPSLHFSGRPYRWLPEPIVPLPPEILERLRPHRAPPPTIADTGTLLDAVDDAIASDDEEPTGDGYALYHGVPDDPHRALRALADKLCRVDVHHGTVVRVVVEANDVYCSGVLSEADAEAIADAARGAETERRMTTNSNAVANAKPTDPKTADGQRVMRIDAMRTRERGPGGAVRAYLLTFLSVTDYDVDSGELQVVWHQDAAPASLHVWEEKLLPREVGQHLGSLGSLAGRAHPKAKPKHVIDAFRDLASRAPPRERQAEDSEPVALVGAILALQVWIVDGEDKYQVLVDTIDGWIRQAGIGVVANGAGHRILYVSSDRLAGGDLSRSAQFRGRTAHQIRKLLADAPGYLGIRRPKNLGESQLRVHAVDLTEFDRIMGRAIPGRDVAVEPQTPFSGKPVTSVTDPTESSEIDMFSARSEGDGYAEKAVTYPSPASPSGSDG